MKKYIALTVIVFLSGCATIVKDNIHRVAVNSYPPADFVVTDHNKAEVISGHTPQAIILRADASYWQGEAYSVRFKKEGYQDTFTPLNSKLSNWYWGNLVFGGLLGFLLIDPATGDMWKLPPSVSATLTK